MTGVKSQLLKLVLRITHTTSAIIPAPPTAPSKAIPLLPNSIYNKTKITIKKAAAPINTYSKIVRFSPGLHSYPVIKMNTGQICYRVQSQIGL